MKWSQFNTWAVVEDRHWVHNGRSGAFVALEQHEYAAAAALVCDGADPEDDHVAEALAALVAHGVLVADRHDEVAELERRFRVDRGGAGALGFTLVASLGCNFDCPYCFETKRPSNLKPEVSDAIVRIVEQANEGVENLHVTWFGGEPLLAAAEILRLSERLVTVCEQRGIEYAADIVTNGWLLTAEMATALRAVGVRTAQVTIDGPEHVHDAARPHKSGGGTFARVIRNVVDASQHIDVSVRVNITRDNLAHVEQLLVELHERGLHDRVRVSFARVVDAPTAAAPNTRVAAGSFLRTSEFAAVEMALADLARRHGFENPLLPARKRLPCAVISPTTAVIGPDGELWKCWDEVGEDRAIVGSIFDHSLANPAIERWHRYSPFDDAQCTACVALPVCMGGCPHLAFEHPLREAQCGTFRYNHVQRVERAARLASGLASDVALDPELSAIRSSPPVAVPVDLRPRRHDQQPSTVAAMASPSVVAVSAVGAARVRAIT